MKRSRLIFATAVALLAGAGAVAPSASAQQRPWQQRRAARIAAQKQRAKEKANAAKSVPGGNGATAPKGQPDVRGLAGLPGPWVQKLGQMSPEEQERFLRNNQRFQSLPPERQQQIRQNLQKWNSLSPTERDAIRDRQDFVAHLSPEQRQHLQNDLLPQWQAMPQERRQLINGRLHVLQGMTPQQRDEALKDPQFMRGLSPDEESMLRDLNSLRNPPAPPKP
jgi:hypothetical protein